METILESKTKTVIIGPDRPLVIIGERINPSGRKQLAAEMASGSNVSFGLPGRVVLNGTFLAMMVANGLTAAITNPVELEIKGAIMAADVFMGYDENCAAWITATRVLEPEAGGGRASPAAGGGGRSAVPGVVRWTERWT